MPRETENPVYLSVEFVKFKLLGLAGLLAGLTVLTHAAQVEHVSFVRYAFACVVSAVLVLIGVGLIGRKWLGAVTVFDRRVLIFVLLTGCVGAVLGLVMHSHYNMDSYVYVPNAVYALQHPNAGMGFEVRSLYSKSGPFLSYVPYSNAFEYGQAVIAYFTHAEYLFIYFIIFPALVGFMIPLALFYAISQFSERTSYAAVGALVTIGGLLLLGETRWTPGNLAFARAFHNKILLLTIGVPAFVGFSYDFFKRPTFLSWAPLFAVCTGMLGITTSTVVMLPALASVLWLSVVFGGSRGARAGKGLDGSSCDTGMRAKDFKDDARKGLGYREAPVLLAYVLSLVYVVGYAVVIRKYAVSTVGADSPLNATFPHHFGGHLALMINRSMPVTPILAGLAAIVSLVFCKRRRELGVWIAAAMILYTNRWVAPVLIKYVTTPNIYWRMFYVLPFPLVIGIAVSSVLGRFGKRMHGRRLAFVTCGCVLVLAVLHYPLWGASVFRPQNEDQVSLPTYDLDAGELRTAREAIQAAPSGVMLCPWKVGGIVTMLDSRYPQISTNAYVTNLWYTLSGQEEEGQVRIQAAAFVGGTDSGIGSFERVIRSYPELKSIVMVKSVWDRAEVRRLMADGGFGLRKSVGGGCVLVVRAT